MKIKNFILTICAMALLFCNNNAFCFDGDSFAKEVVWEQVRALPVGHRPKIVLVLGGGGARGFSHIGVLKAFKEAGIPIDMVVGTSMGALVGALYCAGVSIKEFEHIADDIKWADISNFKTVSLLRMLVSNRLLSTEKLEKYIESTIGDLNFFQLKTPFACVATDMTTGEKIIFKEGKVALAARASANIPGLFSPVEYGQRFLVDGGLVENIPVSVAKLFEPDIIITVALRADITKNSYNSVFAALFQTIYIQGQQSDEINIGLSDIVISPKVNEISAIALDRAAECVNEGFIAGRKSIEHVKDLIIEKTYEKLSEN